MIRRRMRTHRCPRPGGETVPGRTEGRGPSWSSSTDAEADRHARTADQGFQGRRVEPGGPAGDEPDRGLGEDQFWVEVKHFKNFNIRISSDFVSIN